jgi:hypothetical protein
VRDLLEGILIVVLIVGYVYWRAKMWSFPDSDDSTKIQTLFGDEPGNKQ